MSIVSFFHGGGTRRKSDENWDRLQDQLSDAQRQITTLSRELDEARRDAGKHKAWWGQADAGWCSADAEVKRLRVLLSADAGVPGTEPVPAPIEQGCRDTPASNADTQPVPIVERDKAMGLSATQLLPVVPVTPVPPVLDEPLPPVTWGTKQGDKAALEAWATRTAPGSGPTEVSAITGHRAATSVKVQLATSSQE
jgi:hypothetical protein